VSRRAPLDGGRPDWLTARNEVRDDADDSPLLGARCRRRAPKRPRDDSPDDDHGDDEGPAVDPWKEALRRR